MKSIKSALLGKTITGFKVEDDGSKIVFHIANADPVKLVAVGDCCSISWIESIDAPDALIGTVMDVEDIEMPSLGNVSTTKRPIVEEVSYYGLKITTEKGRAIIDYRNDSNGYYGGSLEVSR